MKTDIIKKLKNMSKPLRTKMEKSGFSFGVKKLKGVRVYDDKLKPSTETEIKVGDNITIDQVLNSTLSIVLYQLVKAHQSSHLYLNYF